MNQLLLALALCLPAAGPTEVPQTPDKVLMASIEAMRVNDLHGYLRLTLTDSQLSAMRTSWNDYCSKKPSQDFRDKFADVVAMLSSPSAEDAVMALLEPKLEQARPQMALVAGMVTAMGQMTIEQNTTLTAQQREQALQLVGGVGNWLQHNDLTDTERARKAVHVLCEMVRSLEIETLDEVYALSFDDLLAKGGKLLAAVKGVLQVYGISSDAFLDSVDVRPGKIEGRKATLRVSFEFFGIKSESDAVMVLVDGRWVPEATVQGMPAELAAPPSKG